jgi:hypothetical protein
MSMQRASLLVGVAIISIAPLDERAAPAFDYRHVFTMQTPPGKVT